MKHARKEELEGYLANAESWSSDRVQAIHASRRVAWIVAAGAAVVAMCEAIALMLLMPLKRVEPYTLMVDRQTGYVQLLKPLNPQLVSSEAALTQSFLVQYVIAREGFDIDSLQADYRKTALWSAGSARASYLAAMPASNPASPLAVYPRSTIVDVRVKSVTPLSAGVSMVRFETARRDLGTQPAAPRAWVAVIRHGYSGEPMTAEDRFLNPLGFQVSRYRRSEETLPAEPTPTPVPVAPAALAPGQAAAPPAAANRSSLANVPYGSPLQPFRLP